MVKIVISELHSEHAHEVEGIARVHKCGEKMDLAIDAGYGFDEQLYMRWFCNACSAAEEVTLEGRYVR